MNFTHSENDNGGLPLKRATTPVRQARSTSLYLLPGRMFTFSMQTGDWTVCYMAACSPTNNYELHV